MWLRCIVNAQQVRLGFRRVHQMSSTCCRLLITHLSALKAKPAQHVQLEDSDLLQACPAAEDGNGTSTATDLDHQDAVRQLLVRRCWLS
jgi:hypothetical protein